MLGKTAVAVAVAVVLSVCAEAARAASVTGPFDVMVNTTRADLTFTDGRGTLASSDSDIESHLAGLIRRERAAIITNIYEIQKSGVIETELRWAKNRGVAVYITSNTPRSDSTHIMDPPFWWVDLTKFRHCVGGCIQGNAGAGGLAHSKFMLFYDTRRRDSEASTAHHSAVWISSSNLNSASGTWATNNAITYYDEPTLWWQMWSVWMDMFHGPHSDPDYYRPELGVNQGHSGLIHSPPARTWVEVSPDANATTDMAGEALAAAKGPNVTPETTDTCQIKVLQQHIKDARLATGQPGRTPVQQLARLKQEGCSVTVAVSQGPYNNSDIEWNSQAVLCQAGIPVYYRPHLHDKLIVMKAKFGADINKWRILTGSHNWGRAALLHSDDLLVTVYDPGSSFYNPFNEHANAVIASAGPNRVALWCGGGGSD
jgi:hypothetical protein